MIKKLLLFALLFAAVGCKKQYWCGFHGPAYLKSTPKGPAKPHK